MLHPTGAGKFTMWVSDFGWGQIESVRSLELAKGAPRGEQVRLAMRGAATTIYASPQQTNLLPLLGRDGQAAHAPVGPVLASRSD